MKRKEWSSRRLKYLMHIVGVLSTFCFMFAIASTATALIKRGEWGYLLLGIGLAAIYAVILRIIGELDYRVTERITEEKTQKLFEKIEKLIEEKINLGREKK